MRTGEGLPSGGRLLPKSSLPRWARGLPASTAAFPEAPPPRGRVIPGTVWKAGLGGWPRAVMAVLEVLVFGPERRCSEPFRNGWSLNLHSSRGSRETSPCWTVVPCGPWHFGGSRERSEPQVPSKRPVSISSRCSVIPARLNVVWVLLIILAHFDSPPYPFPSRFLSPYLLPSLLGSFRRFS